MTATDNRPDWLEVELWYRYRKSANQSWGVWWEWELSDSIPPYTFGFIFPKGKGFYEFYSVAMDLSGNREAPPVSADAWIQKK